MIDYKAGREMAENAGEAVLENSVSLALIGAGIGWFVVSNMKGGRRSSRHDEASGRGGGAGSKAARMARSQFAKAEGAAQRAYESVSDTAGQTWSSVRNKGSQLGESAGETAQRVYRRASRTFGDLAIEQPLLLGAAGLVVGATIGALIPGTRYESEWVGETRDDLTRSAKEYGREQLDRAQRVVEKTVETVKSEAAKQGFTVEAAKESAKEAVDEVKDRAAKVANAATDAARAEAGVKDKS